MMEVMGPDGRRFRFPDGVPEDEMKRAMQKVYGKPRIQELQEKVPERDRAGFTDQMLQSATFNTLDEISGAVTAPFSVAKRAITGEDAGKPIGERFSDAYGAERDYQRDRLELYRRENKAGGIAADVAGAVLPAGAVGGALKGVGYMAGIARGAGAGAAGGAAAAAGAAEGGAENRLRAAGQGALLGGAIGGAIPGVTGGIGALTRGGRDAIYGRTNPGDFAAEKVAERLQAGNTSPGVAARRLSGTANRTGQRLALADVTGASGRDLLRTASNIPGRGRDSIARNIGARQFGQQDRVLGLVRDFFEDPRAYGQTVDDIVAARRTQASPLYEEAFSQRIRPTKTLIDLLERPAMRRAYDRAVEMAQNAGESLDDDLGNVRFWDYMKRGLDDVIQREKTDMSPFGVSKMSQAGRALESTQRTMLSELDRLSPAYGRARKIAADNIQASEALEFGRKAFNMSPEQVSRRVQNMSEAQQEIARVGLAEAIRDRVGRAGPTDNALLRFFKSRNDRDVMRALFDNTTDFSRFRQALLNEARMRSTYDAVRGNSTTARQMADMMEARGPAEDMIGMATEAATGGPAQAAIRYIGSRMRMLGGFTPDVADRVGKIMLTRDPATIERLARRLSDISRRRTSQLETRAAIRNAVAGTLGIQADELVDLGEANSVR